MGWGAADAFYEANRSWLESPEDAYDVLYGGRDEPRQNRKPHKCAICGKRFRSEQGAQAHLTSFHARRLRAMAAREPTP